MDDISIVVSVSELRSRIQDIRRSGKEFVEISINPAEKDEVTGELYPATLDFSASRSGETDLWVDFEPIDALENEEALKEISLTATHMSDNLL